MRNGLSLNPIGIGLNLNNNLSNLETDTRT